MNKVETLKSNLMENRYKPKIGDRLRAARLHQRLSTSELAQGISSSQSHVSGVENGYDTCRTSFFLEACAYLDIHPLRLLECSNKGLYFLMNTRSVDNSNSIEIRNHPPGIIDIISQYLKKEFSYGRKR